MVKIHKKIYILSKKVIKPKPQPCNVIVDAATTRLTTIDKSKIYFPEPSFIYDFSSLKQSLQEKLIDPSTKTSASPNKKKPSTKRNLLQKDANLLLLLVILVMKLEQGSKQQPKIELSAESKQKKQLN